MEDVTKYIFERIKSTDFPIECRGMYLLENRKNIPENCKKIIELIKNHM